MCCLFATGTIYERKEKERRLLCQSVDYTLPCLDPLAFQLGMSTPVAAKRNTHIFCRLFWFAWTARSSIHWISPVLSGIPFAWGNLAIFISSALYLVDVYGPLNGASAMAANGLMRYTMGAGKSCSTASGRLLYGQ